MSKPRMPRPTSKAMGMMGGISLGHAPVGVAGAGVEGNSVSPLSVSSSYCGGKVKVGRGRFVSSELLWDGGNVAGASMNWALAVAVCKPPGVCVIMASVANKAVSCVAAGAKRSISGSCDESPWMMTSSSKTQAEPKRYSSCNQRKNLPSTGYLSRRRFRPGAR